MIYKNDFINRLMELIRENLEENLSEEECLDNYFIEAEKAINKLWR